LIDFTSLHQHRAAAVEQQCLQRIQEGNFLRRRLSNIDREELIASYVPPNPGREVSERTLSFEEIR